MLASKGLGLQRAKRVQMLDPIGLGIQRAKCAQMLDPIGLGIKRAKCAQMLDPIGSAYHRRYASNICPFGLGKTHGAMRRTPIFSAKRRNKKWHLVLTQTLQL